jgi:hypothetical protein
MRPNFGVFERGNEPSVTIKDINLEKNVYAVNR